MQPIIIIHRVNTVQKLKETPKKYGVEIDVRHNPHTGDLYLNHDPGKQGEHYSMLEEYLQSFRHAFIIFNLKEAGIEGECIELASRFGIPKERYFLLDVEFPYLYRASRTEGVREIAVRYSEAEPIEAVEAQRGFVDWVWIDTNTRLPLDMKTKQRLAGFKACLVSPDRWGRPEEIVSYRDAIRDLSFPLTAVMVGLEYVHLWE
jgi:hypothetical protein